jgi:hypothetical protein
MCWGVGGGAVRHSPSSRWVQEHWHKVVRDWSSNNWNFDWQWQKQEKGLTEMAKGSIPFAVMLDGGFSQNVSKVNIWTSEEKATKCIKLNNMKQD